MPSDEVDTGIPVAVPVPLTKGDASNLGESGLMAEGVEFYGEQ
jgi:hypothetical protein